MLSRLVCPAICYRLKELKEKPYDHVEAQAAGGMGSYEIQSTKPLLHEANMDTTEDKV